MATLNLFEEILQVLGLLQGPTLAPQDVVYAGMDILAFPGSAFMQYLKAATNLRWTAAYFVSPTVLNPTIPPNHFHPADGTHAARNDKQSHTDPTWNAGVVQARAAGFGILPVYWGQQNINNKDGPWNATVAVGQQDGADAVTKALAVPHDPHAVLYLDWEGGIDNSRTDSAYCVAWFTAVAEGGFRPGLYAHGVPANPVSQTLRAKWPDLFVWITNPFLTAEQAFVVPRVGSVVQINTTHRPTANDPDAIASQVWFSSLHWWSSRLTFPAPALPATLPISVGGLRFIDATGAVTTHFGLDASVSSVADPAFPELAMAPALVRRGRVSAAAIDGATLVQFRVRAGALLAITWSVPSPVQTFLALPDHSLAYNPWAPHSTLQRGTNGDLAIIARSKVVGTTDDAWQVHAFRRRGTTWTFDENITAATTVSPLLGLQCVTRAADTVEVLFSRADDIAKTIYVVATRDAASQTDGQAWTPPQALPAPSTGIIPSLVGGIGAISRAAGVVDAFVVGRPSIGAPWQLFWTMSPSLGSWPTPFAVPGDPNVRVHPFSNVAAVSPDPAGVHAFAIAKGGSDAAWMLYTWIWRTADQWGAAPAYHTQAIRGTKVSPHPMSKIRTANRSPQFIDVFIVGVDDGLLYNAFWDASTDVWSDFRPVSTVAGKSVLVATIDAAIARDANNVDVIVTGRDGNVYISSWNSTMSVWPPLVIVPGLKV